LIEYNDLNAEMPTHDRLIHLHVTRCGGTAFDRILRELRKHGLKPIGAVKAKHLAYKHLAETYTSRGLLVPPAIAFIRNPWSWYVAFWSWVRVVDYTHFQGDFNEYVKLVSQKRHGSCVSLTIYWEMMQADKADYIVRMEDWYSGIVPVFAKVGIVPDLVTAEEADQIIRSVGTARVDRHPDPNLKRTRWEAVHPYQEYYNEESKALVARMDGELIRRFGYEF